MWAFLISIGLGWRACLHVKQCGFIYMMWLLPFPLTGEIFFFVDVCTVAEPRKSLSLFLCAWSLCMLLTIEFFDVHPTKCKCLKLGDVTSNRTRRSTRSIGGWIMKLHFISLCYILLDIIIWWAQFVGLEYLHNGLLPLLIHRDVKATNVLLNERLEAKIADFGLSSFSLWKGSLTDYLLSWARQDILIQSAAEVSPTVMVSGSQKIL